MLGKTGMTIPGMGIIKTHAHIDQQFSRTGDCCASVGVEENEQNRWIMTRS